MGMGWSGSRGIAGALGALGNPAVVQPFIFGRLEGPGFGFVDFRFSVFSLRFRLVICWVGVLLIPTILFENFQRNAGNAAAEQDSTCRVYRYFN